MKKQVCLIVDAYSSGKYLAPSVSAYGYDCAHIHSSLKPLDYLLSSFNAADFIFDYYYNGSISDVVEEFKEYNIKCVIPGTETGVELADSLAVAFDVLHNDTAKSNARRNKYAMSQCLQSCELAIIPQISTADIDEALNWVKSINFPVVVKPLQGSASAGYHRCENANDVMQAFSNLLNKENIFSQTNTQVLVQKFIDSQEYVIDTVSFAGQHYVTDIGKVDKINAGQAKIYDKSVPVTYMEAEAKGLLEYAFKVLDALGIKYGPAHTELFLTDEFGPILIETGARLIGTLDLSCAKEFYGESPSDVVAEAYLNSEKFLNRVKNKHFTYKNEFLIVSLISHQSGIVKSIDLEKLQQLKTYFHHNLFISVGSEITPTRDLLSIPGVIYLQSADKKALLEDCHKIRELEKEGLLYKT